MKKQPGHEAWISAIAVAVTVYFAPALLLLVDEYSGTYWFRQNSSPRVKDAVILVYRPVGVLLRWINAPSPPQPP